MKLNVAAVQASPVYLDRDATIEKVGDLLAQAARQKAKLAVFGEAFVPTYPDWVWRLRPGDGYGVHDELYALLLDQSVAVPSKATERLGAVAKKTKTYLAIGVNEKEADRRAGSGYHTLLDFGPDRRRLGQDPQLLPPG